MIIFIKNKIMKQLFDVATTSRKMISKFLGGCRSINWIPYKDAAII
jgi:hypothetical protein